MASPGTLEAQEAEEQQEALQEAHQEAQQVEVEEGERILILKK